MESQLFSAIRVCTEIFDKVACKLNYKELDTCKKLSEALSMSVVIFQLRKDWSSIILITGTQY